MMPHVRRQNWFTKLAPNTPDDPSMDGSHPAKGHAPGTLRRHGTLSEFVHDLSHLNPEFMKGQHRPLLEKDPAKFWRLLALAMVFTNLVLVHFLLS